MCGRLLPSSWQLNQKWLLAALVFIVPFFAASQQDIPEIHIDEIDHYEEELIDFLASRINEWGYSGNPFLTSECSTDTVAARLSCTEEAVLNHIATNLNWDYVETTQSDRIFVEFTPPRTLVTRNAIYERALGKTPTTPGRQARGHAPPLKK